MFRFLKKLFFSSRPSKPLPPSVTPPPSVHERSVAEANETGLRWECRIATREQAFKGWSPLAGGEGDAYLQFFCPHCDGELTPGPSGSGATNQVCEKCRINFGCLPDALIR